MVVCQVAFFFERVPKIFHNLCVTTADCGLLALNLVKRMNSSIGKGWEMLGQN